MNRVIGSCAAVLLAAFAAACEDEAAPVLPTDSGVSADSGEEATDAAAEPPSDAGTVNADASATGADASPRDGSSVVDTCNPLAQNCQAPDTKCVIEGGPAMCVPTSANDVPLDAACTGEDCLAGLACVHTSSTTCLRICDFDGAGAGCETLGSDFECRTRITGTNWGACLLLPPLCDHLTQAPCAQDQACGPLLRRTGSWEFRCRPAGAQAEGQTCGANGGGNCQRGLVCVRDPASNLTCRKYCSVNNDCTAPATCTGSVNDPPFMFCAN